MPHQTLSIASPKNIVDDVANSVTVRYNQVYNRRPLWTLHVNVDKVAFLIGGVGSVVVGFVLNQYEPNTYENPAYYAESTDAFTSFFYDAWNDTLNHPISVLERFFLGGTIYVGVGLLTEGILHVTKPVACGLITGCYFAYGAKITIGFGLFAAAVETVFYFVSR